MLRATGPLLSAALGVCRRPAAVATLRRAFASLSAPERERYLAEGWVVPGFRFDNGTVAAGRTALDGLLARNPGVAPEQLVNAHLEAGEGSAMGVRGSSELLRLAAHPDLADLVADALGVEDVILWGVQVFCKPPHTGRAVPWHQDGQYWPIDPLRACTAWLALDISDAENGALRVVPGTHRAGYLPHERREDAEAAISVVVTDETLGPERLAAARTLELDPGQVSIHDAMLVHGSERNRSSRRRAGVACHYMPAECHFQRNVRTMADREGGLNLDYSSRPLIVVRGSNRHPENDQFLDM